MACCFVCLPGEAGTWERYRRDHPKGVVSGRGELPELEAVSRDEWEAWRSQEFNEVSEWQAQA